MHEANSVLQWFWEFGRGLVAFFVIVSFIKWALGAVGGDRRAYRRRDPNERYSGRYGDEDFQSGRHYTPPQRKK